MSIIWLNNSDTFSTSDQIPSECTFSKHATSEHIPSQNIPSENMCSQNIPSKRVWPLLRVFAHMSDSELRDPKQLVGLSRACDITIPEEGIFIAESRNVIERALRAGHTPFALISEKRWFAPHQDLFEYLERAYPAMPLFIGSHQDIRIITGFERTVGPIAAFFRPALPHPSDLLKSAKRVAILEDITNFTNIGAIFRSAAALGIDCILVTPGCHDPFYRRAARVSMGSVFQVPWTRIGTNRDWTNPNDPTNNTNDGLALLKRMGFVTCALALKKESLRLQDERISKAEKLALVLGSEGDGLAPDTIAQCDHTVYIPMAHDVDSLNVAAASAVAFWETCGKFLD